MKKIVLASNNQHKLKEIAQALESLAWSVVSQASQGVESCEETGLSFIENALIKARHAAKETGLAAIADDSGLSVDALDGAPGIYSARFAGLNATDQQNNKKLIENLAAVAPPRTARYHCVIAYLKGPTDPQPKLFEGRWEGEIVVTPQGTQGFGYDPLFYLAKEGCTAAQLTLTQKQALSHRGQALHAFLNFMTSEGSDGTRQ